MDDDQPSYSEKYFDDVYEYRHVMLPAHMARKLTPPHLMSEDEWRDLGVQQSVGWEHYAHHKPEPHIMLFRRRLEDSPAPPPGALEMLEKRRLEQQQAKENGTAN